MCVLLLTTLISQYTNILQKNLPNNTETMDYGVYISKQKCTRFHRQLGFVLLYSFSDYAPLQNKIRVQSFKKIMLDFLPTCMYVL